MLTQHEGGLLRTLGGQQGWGGRGNGCAGVHGCASACEASVYMCVWQVCTCVCVRVCCMSVPCVFTCAYASCVLLCTHVGCVMWASVHAHRAPLTQPPSLSPTQRSGFRGGSPTPARPSCPWRGPTWRASAAASSSRWRCPSTRSSFQT